MYGVRVGLWDSYRMRLRRKRRLIRAVRKSHELKPLQDNTGAIRPNDHLLVATMRNEQIRLPYFLEYYRNLGVDHFLFVDNASQDGTVEYLRGIMKKKRPEGPTESEDPPK